MQPIQIGKYRLLKRIAAGGMAEIFVAKVTGISGFEKIVVVKRILPQLATNKEFTQMFLDEARIAATLHHPNIVQMYDIGSVEGQYFISMEYLHGEDVRSLMKALRVRQEGLPLELAIHIVVGLAAGLHYAHEKVGFDGRPLGIVHRDVTPQNIFITYDGSIKIVDFGIAKATNRLGETRYGTLKGKVPYMSPEQCRSEALDRRADVFAIGIILYELTTGYRLFKGQSEFDIMKRVVEGTIVLPTSLRATYPKDLEAIVMKALAKKKEDRYPTAQALQAELEAFGREHRLAVSAISLASFMAKVFGQKVEAWREAMEAGTLADHIAEKSDVGEPGSPSGDDDDEGELAVDNSRTPSAAGELAAPAALRRRVWPAVVGMAALAVAAVVAWVKLTPPPGGQAVAPPPTEASEPAPAEPEEQPLGILKVSTKPAGASVLVDGTTWAEKTPTVVDSLTVGSHRVEVKAAGFVGAHQEAAVVLDEVSAVAFDLVKEKHEASPPPETPPTEGAGGETQEGNPEGDGEPHRHKRDRGDKTTHADKGAKAGEEKEPSGEPGELRVASAVSCEVLVNGKAKGFTPIQLKLPAGKYSLQCVNSRFGVDSKRSIEVRPGQVTKERF